jgi:hypothetical protein
MALSTPKRYTPAAASCSGNFGGHLSAKQITHPISQAVIGCGFDQNLEKGARWPCWRVMNSVRTCFRKILQQKLPNRRSSRCQNIHLKTSRKNSNSKSPNRKSIHLHTHKPRKTFTNPIVIKLSGPLNFRIGTLSIGVLILRSLKGVLVCLEP